jgi:hypothetical protein
MIYYLVAPLFLLASIVLLFIGVRQDKAWALYSTKVSWIIILVVSFYLTLLAWKGRAYGENWDMIGVIFIVWPITVVVVLLAAAELFMLRGRQDRHVRVFRFLAIAVSTLMVVLSVSVLLIWR